MSASLGTNRWQLALPLLVLVAGAAGAWALIKGRVEVKTEAPSDSPPAVEVQVVQPESVRVNVHTQGTVSPRYEIDLVTQVAGKVVKVHPAFHAGGFFEAGALLVAIDPRDYELATTRAESRLADAKRLLAQEEAAAEQAEGEWKVLGEGQPTAMALHLPQLAAARAGVKAAEADLAESRLNRSRCELRAPFAGRIREKWAGIGQFLSVGDRVARIHSVDVAEVRLPLTPDQLAYVALPGERLSGSGAPPHLGSSVKLSVDFGRDIITWIGHLARTEGIADESTGLVYVVAEIQHPYASGPERQPLRIGSFVQAEIEGRELNGVFILPRSAVSASQDAVLVNGADRLEIRHLEVIRTEPTRVLVRGGLASGDRVLVSGIDLPVAGTLVRPQLDALPAADSSEPE